jgi:hypothetical protein
LRVGIHVHAAHDVMGRRPDLHWLFGNINIAKRFELMIHARQFAFDVLFGVADLLFDP